MMSIFRWPLILTAMTLLAVWWWAGAGAAFIVAVLALFEISLSFDNAVVNAKMLNRMGPMWQHLFLTLGLAIAVFGMRLVFPLAIVSLAANIGPAEVLHLAVDAPSAYAAVLQQAHPAIAGFGGMFLLMLFLDFIVVDRKIKWLQRIESGLAQLGRLANLTVIMALMVLLLASEFLAGGHLAAVLVAGAVGILTYLIITSLTGLFELGSLVKPSPQVSAAQAIARAGLFSFIYLEVIDASFSFDGIVGAFAITNQIFLIVAGLGIGALFVRALTVALVRHRALSRYVYLEHGAHYAVGALALVLLVGLRYHVPQILTGLIGVGFMLLAFLDSREYRRQNPEWT